MAVALVCGPSEPGPVSHACRPARCLFDVTRHANGLGIRGAGRGHRTAAREVYATAPGYTPRPAYGTTVAGGVNAIGTPGDRSVVSGASEFAGASDEFHPAFTCYRTT